MAEIVKCAKCGRAQPDKWRSGAQKYYCSKCGQELNTWLNLLSHKVRVYERSYQAP